MVLRNSERGSARLAQFICIPSIKGQPIILEKTIKEGQPDKLTFLENRESSFH